ncbi:MAG: glycosyltransferase family 2 protein [Hyphomonadaceae bacterium]|nr:glycosyltransferase family 2 protein [Hyphomonadaceae bacterium]MBX3510904.1 glycosyltransferase family 2 protein [Hyphomonadaceae bacterium]
MAAAEQNTLVEHLAPQTTRVELTILMPCLNEAETLAVCIDKARGYLARSGVVGEVVIADNGSTDGSQEIARRHGARVVDVPRRGYGAAILGGIEAARGDYIIMGDADDSYDFSELDAYVERLRDGADLVMGNRFKGGVAEGAMPFLHRYLGNPVLSLIGRVFFDIPIGDFHCGLRGFNAARVRQLQLVTTGMEFASEMVVRSALERYRVEEVPTTLKPDGRSRAPHLKTWRDGWRHLKFLLIYSPKWLYLYPGLALIAAGAALAGALSLGPVVLGDAVLGMNSFVAACFMLITGVQLVSFGALARFYATLTGMLPRGARSDWLRGVFSTDNLARIGALLFVVGLGAFGMALWQWASVGFGDLTDLTTPRVVLLGLSAMVIGVQLAFLAFFASILEAPIIRDAAKR